MRQFQVLKAGDPKFATVSGFGPDLFLFLVGPDFISSRTKPISSRTWASLRARGASVRPFVRSSVRAVTGHEICDGFTF